MAKGRDTAERDGNAYSGRLLLRMSPDLHAEAARVAEREGVSLNHFITGALARAVGSDVPEEASEPPTDSSQPEATEQATSSPRLLNAALAVNFVVVTLAGAIAITLLVVAWQRGL